MMKDKKTDFLYCLVQGLYWVSYGIAVSFSSVFLKGLGYSNFELGLIMSCGHILGFIFSNTLGVLIDNNPKFSIPKIINIVLTFNVLVVIINSFIREKTFLLYITYPLYVALTVSVNAMIIKLWVDFCHYGRNINYSFARSVGSFCYIFLSIALGILLTNKSIFIMPFISLGIIACQFIINYFISKNLCDIKALCCRLDAYNKVSDREALSLFSFCRTYRKFTLFLFGMSFVFLAHYTTGSSFLINIVTSVGGDNQSLGNINAYMAGIEIFVFLLYPFYRKYISCRTLLSISAIFFSVKIYCLSLAKSMPDIYLIFLTHLLSYAIFIPTIVDFVKEEIPYEDSAKGQSLASTISIIGSCLAGIVGGVLYDTFDVKTTVLIAFLFCVIGTIICLIGLKKA